MCQGLSSLALWGVKMRDPGNEDGAYPGHLKVFCSQEGKNSTSYGRGGGGGVEGIAPKSRPL